MIRQSTACTHMNHREMDWATQILDGLVGAAGTLTLLVADALVDGVVLCRAAAGRSTWHLRCSAHQEASLAPLTPAGVADPRPVAPLARKQHPQASHTIH
jgi:hypothetical protein